MRIRSSVFTIALLSSAIGWLGCSGDDEAGPAVTGTSRDTRDGGASSSGTTASSSSSSGGGDDSGPAPVDLQPFRIVGRFDSRDAAGPRFGWPGTAIIARFTGASISVELADTTGEDQFDVSIDGKEPTLLRVDSQERKTYELGSGLGAGEHTLALTKRTESLVGETQLFAINATLVGTPPLPNRRIEMVGDSITAGYGVLGADETCTFSADTENESLAWGALAAKELGAVHTAIAWSGIGLVQDYEGDTDNQIPDRYPRALASDAESKWTASQFPPDVIVIGIGTNDLSGQGGDPGDAFQTKMIAFLGAIRAVHPNAHIVLATSPLMSGNDKADQKRYFEGAIAARPGDAKLSLLDITSVTEDEGFGCDFHPSKKTQARMAKTLVTHVKTLTGW